MAYPVEFAVIVPLLKQILKDRGVTYAELARRLHISEAGVKKIMSAKDCSLKRLNQICEALDFSILDLIELLRERPVKRVLLNPAQQSFLTADESCLLLYFKVAFENVPPGQARKELGLTETAFEKKLNGLEKIGLLKRTPGGKIAAPEEHFGIWPDEGELTKLVKHEWSGALVKAAAHGHQSTGQDISLRYFRLSEKSLRDLRARLAEVFSEFDRASMIESKLAPYPKHVSCMYALAPESISNIRQRFMGRSLD
jgi:DNA-binding Xre family transcriptional regulator